MGSIYKHLLRIVRTFDLTPVQLIRYLPKHPIVNLVGEVNRLLDYLAAGYHAHIHLPLPCQPQTGNNASAGINQRAVQPRHSCVRVEHAKTSTDATVRSEERR